MRRIFFLLQGPPGTGKTTLIVELVAQILARSPSSRILVSSQTHDAVDNALERLEGVASLLQVGWRMVRDAPASSNRARGSFDQSFSDWVGRVRVKSEEAFRSAQSKMPAEAAAEVAAALADWRSGLEQTADVKFDFASSVQVFAATCLRVPAVLKLVRDEVFDWVIVDEAAKATPTEVLVPMVSAKRVVLVGDHKQLPPFLDTQTADALRAKRIDPERAKVSLFEELFARMPDSNRSTLTTQFRMHPSIGTFVGDLFYRDVGGLASGVSEGDRELDVPRFGGSTRVFWIDTLGKPEQDGTSFYNRAEQDAVATVLQFLSREGRQPPYDVAVIAPYMAQVRRLQRQRFAGNGLNITCATVDAFQGRQVDVVLYSMVRDVGGGFVSDPRRLNVAFSRCKRLLVIIGNSRAAGGGALKRVLERVPPEGRLTLEELRANER